MRKTYVLSEKRGRSLRYLNAKLPHINEDVKTIDGYNGIVQSVSVLKQLVKVIITKDNDEKEVREYHVDDLKFEKSASRTSGIAGTSFTR